MSERELVLSDSLLELSQLFPDVSLLHLKHILNTSNNDLDDAIDQMLNYEFIKDEIDQILKEKNLNGKSDPQISHTWELVPSKGYSSSERLTGNVRHRFKKNRTKSQNAGVSGESKPSKQVYETQLLFERLLVQDSIMELLEIDHSSTPLIEWYMQINDYDKLSTIYDILLNFNPNLPSSKQSRHTLNTVSDKAIAINETEFSNSQLSMASTLKLDVKNIYVPENNHCWNELEDFLVSNPNFNPPKKICLLAIKWFDNDISKTLNLLININDCFENKTTTKKQIEKKMQSSYQLDDLTISNIDEGNQNGFETINKFDKLPDSYNDENYSSIKSSDALIWRSKNLKNIMNVTNDKNIRAYYGQSINQTKEELRRQLMNEQIKDVSDRIEKAKKSFCIDFHNLSVQNAIYALKQLLDYWWGIEMTERNLQNTRFELTTVTYVPPLTVITGRGLHSAGSIPKIKNASINYLNANKYKFETHMSKIIISGKKR